MEMSQCFLLTFMVIKPCSFTVEPRCIKLYPCAMKERKTTPQITWKVRGYSEPGSRAALFSLSKFTDNPKDEITIYKLNDIAAENIMTNDKLNVLFLPVSLLSIKAKISVKERPRNSDRENLTPCFHDFAAITAFQVRGHCCTDRDRKV